MAMTLQFLPQPATSTAVKTWAVTSALSPPSRTPIGLGRPIDRFSLRISPLSSSFRLPHSSASPKFSMRAASKQAYICRDCGFIYNDKTPFEKLPDKYFCPVCAAPKRRFKPYEAPVNKNANSTDVRKARKEEIKRDEKIGKALPIGIVVGIAILGGVYYYVNTAF